MTALDIPEGKTVGFLNLASEDEESAFWSLGQLQRFKKVPPFPPFIITDFLSLQVQYTKSNPPLIIFGNPDVDLVYPLVQSELASWFPHLSDAELSSLLENVGLSYVNLFRTTASLSGGQQLLLSLLPLWQQDVRCVMLYHVSPWLDATSRALISSRLQELRAKKVDVFVFEREESQLLSVCDDIFVQLEGNEKIISISFPKIGEVASGLYPIHDGHNPTEKREHNTKALSATNLRYRYPKADEDVFTDVSIDINVGEVVGLIGPNGSGKSTLAKMLSGLVLPTAGKICLDDQDISTFSLHDRSRKLALLFQSPGKQLCGLNIDQEFSIGLSQSERDSAIAYFQTHSTIELSTPFSQIRNWQQRLILLSIALARNPRILILDEPTWGLSISERRQLMHLLLDLSNRSQTGILIISHDFNLIMAMCQRAYHLKDAALTHIGNPIEWFNTETNLPPDLNISQSLKRLAKPELRAALATRY